MIEERRRAFFGMSSFPKEPSAYSLIGTYTASGTFTAESSGWYQIELQGVSGHCGKSTTGYDDDGNTWAKTGGAGGGGGCSISRVKLKKGDTVVYSLGKTAARGGSWGHFATIQGGSSSASVKSSFDEYDHTMSVSGAYNGGWATQSDDSQAGEGGAGGIGSGGNYGNYSGRKGGNGSYSRNIASYAASSASGGTAGYSGGNAGGKSPRCAKTTGIWDIEPYGPDSDFTDAYNGKDAFIKIYAGNTN